MNKNELIESLTTILETLTAPEKPHSARLSLLDDAEISVAELQTMISHRESTALIADRISTTDLEKLVDIYDSVDGGQLDDLVNMDLPYVIEFLSENDLDDVKANLEKVEDIDNTLDEIRSLCDSI